MSNQIQLSTFNFETNSIRTLSINNEPWFIAKDLCLALGIDNNRKALLALDDDEKGVTLSNTLGGKQEMNIVSESGMYTLILRCRDAVKKGSVPHRFRKWVTSEVLPQIRKTGQYSAQPQQLMLPEPKPQTITIPRSGRWLVITDDLDPTRNVIKNIDGHNCINANIHRKLIRETHLMADLLLELAHRMRIVEGECSPTRFDTPILQIKRNTII